jgi:DNA-binding transcriptional LysR family regulator
MTRRNIGHRDLNLLNALKVLLEERNVTRAADRLNLTQPAVSRILARLRVAFDDPLFVRTSRGLTPTARAIEVAGPLRRSIDALERILVEGTGFEPARAKRRFRIAAVDYAQVTLLAPLFRALSEQAPQIDFELRQPTVESERELEAGTLDLLIMPQQPSGLGIVWTPLYKDGYTCIVWEKHPLRALTVPRFAAMEHVLVAPRERAGGIVDQVLQEQGLSRRVAVQAPTFLLLPHLLVGTKRIATVPIGMAKELATLSPLRIVKPPLTIPGFTMCQGWHEIHRSDPGHHWLRDAIAKQAAKRNGARPN